MRAKMHVYAVGRHKIPAGSMQGFGQGLSRGLHKPLLEGYKGKSAKQACWQRARRAKSHVLAFPVTAMAPRPGSLRVALLLPVPPCPSHVLKHHTMPMAKAHCHTMGSCPGKSEKA